MIFTCVGMIAVIFAADFIIKSKIEKSEKLPRTVLHGHVFLQKYHNRGAALNLGEKKPWLVTLCSVLLTLCALCFLIFSFGNMENRLLLTGLSLLLGGGFNNTYDRLRRKYVVDYISFPKMGKRFSRIVFNFSDFCIIAGAVMVCVAKR